MLDHSKRVDEAAKPVLRVADAHVEAHIQQDALANWIKFPPPRQMRIQIVGRAVDIVSEKLIDFRLVDAVREHVRFRPGERDRADVIEISADADCPFAFGVEYAFRRSPSSRINSASSTARSYVGAVGCPFGYSTALTASTSACASGIPRRSRIASKMSLSVSMSFPAECFAHPVVDVAEQLRGVAGDAR
jgi:hypothetical protein